MFMIINWNKQITKSYIAFPPIHGGHIPRPLMDTWNQIVPNPIYTMFFSIHTYQWWILTYKVYQEINNKNTKLEQL